MNKYFVLIFFFALQIFTSANAQQMQMVKDLNPGSPSSYPRGLTVANSKLFFAADINSTGQYKLFLTGGTSATTQQLLGVDGSNIQNLIAYKNNIYFSCHDATNGQELWVSDGTVAGTKLFMDIIPGSNGSYPEYFTVCNNKLFFRAVNPLGGYDMYVTDGTAAGTIMLQQYVDVFNGLSDFGILTNSIYFRGVSGTGQGYGLWKSDGTLAGTQMVYANTANGFIPGTQGCNTAQLNNKLYFSGSDFVYGTELWVTDGTTAGTHIVVDIGTQSGGTFSGGSPFNLFVYNSLLYFTASDNAHGAELWVTDGTAPGSHLVKDILAGPSGSIPYHTALYNGLMYITCWGSYQLWKSDGTAAGTQLVHNIPDQARFGALWNNKMYFTFGNAGDIWQSDGTPAGTSLFTASNSINPVTFSSLDIGFTEYNSSIYFSGSCSDITNGGYELTKLVATIPTSFSFTGNGNWSNPANWAGGIVPPSTLPSGSVVTINGACILDVAQHIASGATLIVAAGKSLVINGSLIIS